MDAAVDMGFGGKIDDGTRLVFGKQTADEIEIANVAFDEGVAGVAFQYGEVFQIACVGQGIEVDHRFVRLGQPIENEVATNEAGTASHKNTNHLTPLTYCQFFKKYN